MYLSSNTKPMECVRVILQSKRVFVVKASHRLLLLDPSSLELYLDTLNQKRKAGASVLSSQK